MAATFSYTYTKVRTSPLACSNILSCVHVLMVLACSRQTERCIGFHCPRNAYRHPGHWKRNQQVRHSVYPLQLIAISIIDSMSSGFLWNVGALPNYDSISQLLHSARSGATDASFSGKVMIHLADGWKDKYVPRHGVLPV